MIPLVLGGIALATVGYGVKKYCENDGKGCEVLTEGLIDLADMMEDLEAKLGLNDYSYENSSSSSTDSDNLLDAVHRFKNEIYNGSIVPFVELLDSIKYYDAGKFPYKEQSLNQEFTENLSDECKADVAQYSYVLKKASKKLLGLVTVLQEIVKEKEDYTLFTKTEKRTLEKASAYAKIIIDLLAVKIVKKSGKINVKLEQKVLLAMQRLMEIEAVNN